MEGVIDLPRITWSNIKKSLGINSVKTRDTLIYEAVYKPTSPLMIGDFGGQHYRVFYNKQKGEYGLTITGLPTAKTIIGKARWLLRVAIAHALNLKSHKEAEQKLHIPIGDGTKISLISFLFGGVKPVNHTRRTEGAKSTAMTNAWKGIIRLQVEPQGKLRYMADETSQSEKNTLKMILKTRKEIVEEKYVKSSCAEEENCDDFFYVKDNQKYWVLKPNRFNSLLALGSEVIEVDSRWEIIPKRKREEEYYMIEPLRHDILQFKLSIYIENRINLSINNLYDNIKQLLVAIIGVSRMLLGLGKGANRGFGHFYIANEEYCDPAAREICALLRAVSDNPTDELLRKYFEKLVKIINDMQNTLGYGSKQYTVSLKDSKIPRLPIYSVKNSDFIAVHEGLVTPEEATNKIARAALKRVWVNELKLHPMQVKITIWPLGLPRSGPRSEYVLSKISNIKDYKKPRRQSVLTAYPGKNGKIVVLLFPSGDLWDFIEVKPRFRYAKDADEKEDRVLAIRNKRTKYIKLINRKIILNYPTVKLLLKEVFDNYNKLL